MADYTAPFHMPQFSDDKFEAKKAEYIKKHGYVITFPRIGDIISLGTTPPMTSEEKILYYSRRKNEIPQSRLRELQLSKARKKERFDRMMGSPTPKLVRSWASIMTAIDDCQDAFITLAAIGRIAVKFLPRILSRFLMGPIGWLWLVAECMNFLMMPTACALNPRGCKRALRIKMKGRKGNMKARMKAYPKSGSIIPSFSEGIQALQVSRDIYGWGLALGPIIGIATDLASGAIRFLRGEKVSFRNPPTDLEIFQKINDQQHNYARWRRPKGEMSKAAFEIWKFKKQQAGTWHTKSKVNDLIGNASKMHSTYGGILRKTDWMLEAAMYTTWEVAMTGARTVMDEWNPLENIEGLEHIQIEAPRCTCPLTEEIFLEAGMDPENYVGWPSLGKRWATIEEISASIAPIAAESFDHYSENCDNWMLKHVVEGSAINGGLAALSLIEGEETLDLEYHATLDITEMLLDHGFSFPRTVTETQIVDFGFWTVAHQENNTRPTLWETLAYTKNTLGFEFTTNPGARPEIPLA